jgi:hypothetical protein
MTPLQEKAWTRLQALSIEHGRRIGPHYVAGFWHKGVHHERTVVDPTIKENAEILGRADEAEMKDRIHWYITFHPSVFDSVTA